MSLHRQWLLIAFAVIGAFLIAGLLGSIAGAQTDYWDWEGRGSLFATFSAVQVAYFAAPRYRLLLACGVLVIGGIFSGAIAEYLWNFVGYLGEKKPVIPHFMGGVIGLSMALLIRWCSTLNLPTFRQWLLAALTLVGAFLTAAVLTAVVLRFAVSAKLGYWNHLPTFFATLFAVLVTYFAVPRYRIFLAFCVFAILTIVFWTFSNAAFHPVRRTFASGVGGIIGLLVAFLANPRHVPGTSSFRPWVFGTLAVIGGSFVGALVGDVLGHSAYREPRFWGVLTAVLITYFAASRNGLILAFCTFVVGAVLSYMFEPSPNFGYAQSTYVRAIANCMGGITGLFLIVVAKDCSTSEVSAFRQRLLIAFAVTGVFVAAGIFGSIVANRLGYWDLPPRPGPIVN